MVVWRSLRCIICTDLVLVDGLQCRWVPIRGNDWYYIRETIKVGMRVQVEVLVIVLSPILMIIGNKMHLVCCLVYDKTDWIVVWEHRRREIHIDFGFLLRCDSWIRILTI